MSFDLFVLCPESGFGSNFVSFVVKVVVVGVANRKIEVLVSQV